MPLSCVTRVCLGLRDAEEEQRCCGLNARVPRFMCCYPNSQGDGVERGNLQRRLVWRWGPRERDQPPCARAPTCKRPHRAPCPRLHMCREGDTEPEHMGTLTSDLSLNASTWSVGFSLQRSMVCAQEWGRADKAVRIHASHSASSDFFSAQRRQSTSSIKQARDPRCCSQLHVCCGARRAEAAAAGKGSPNTVTPQLEGGRHTETPVQVQVVPPGRATLQSPPPSSTCKFPETWPGGVLQARRS